ncbi:hypothetical protein SLEP1_g32000 [Rubroshorea leprosula]|uniref:Uncharacterized protein n=1 Tax=Rubroshorea leprosula TaxID=152421 RepID=A0AAV5KBY1_9ROSI|nr:hypothetical protein SLEP1_g32000 [Rubroshorea leprosula]
MSSEETMSVVGSEVMPLEYGGMNSESSPSSSERTVEGVGGGEVVGVGGDTIPITVVEVEGRRERCYDVDADIVGEVKQYKSELGTRDSLGPARVEEKACSAPRDHWMPVYAHYLVVGLRGSRKDKGWYYFTPRVANRESRTLFTAGPSSIKGWKEKFFFVDDIEWERGDVEVELLSSLKAKRANQNKFRLNEDEEEEVGKLVREGGNLVNIMYLTGAECIEAAELYGSSALTKMDKFLNAAGGVAIPKKPRKKLKTSTKGVDEGVVKREVVPSISTGMEEEVPRLELKRKGREEEGALQRKKRVVEEEERGSEVPQFMPQPPPVELDPELRESKEGVENMTGARRFINAIFPEVDKRHAWDEALRYCGASVVKHVLEEFMESVKERSLLQSQCDQLQKEKEELEKKNKEMQEALDKVVPAVKRLEQERASLSTKLEAYMELKKNVQLLVHNGMEEHISNFVSSSSFDSIVNLYRLPTAILAFTNCRKKVKAEYPEMDITKITFGEQEKGVEENGERISIDFRPQIKLRWEHDVDGRTVFPLRFDFEFVVVEEEEAEGEEDEVGAGVEGAEVDESQPPLLVEIH